MLVMCLIFANITFCKNQDKNLANFDAFSKKFNKMYKNNEDREIHEEAYKENMRKI